MYSLTKTVLFFILFTFAASGQTPQSFRRVNADTIGANRKSFIYDTSKFSVKTTTSDSALNFTSGHGTNFKLDGRFTLPTGALTNGRLSGNNAGVASWIASDTVGLGSFLSTKPDTGRTITINGTANQITSSAGAQSLSAPRTWTLSLPSVVYNSVSDTTFRTRRFYADNGNSFIDRSALLTLNRGDTTNHTGTWFSGYFIQNARGDSGVTFKGSGGLYVRSYEDTTNGGSNGRKRGVMLGVDVDVVPYTENTPYTANRDATAYLASNQGGVLATEAIYIGGSAAIPTTSANPYQLAWSHGVTVNDRVGAAFISNGANQIGLSLSGRTRIGVNSYAIQTSVSDTSVMGKLALGSTTIDSTLTVTGGIRSTTGLRLGGSAVVGTTLTSGGATNDSAWTSSSTQGIHIGRGLKVDGTTTVGSLGGTVRAVSGLLSATASDTVGLATALALKAPIASPTFTGTVTIPTPFTLGAVSVTSTGTQLNYLSSAGGTTGTTSTNVVFSTSPSLTTPALGVATGTSLALGGVTLDSAITTASTQGLHVGRGARVDGLFALGATVPQEKFSQYATASTNTWNMTATDLNITTSSHAQAIDTSSINWSFSNTGKPLLSVTGTTGNGIVNIDTAGVINIGTAITTPLAGIVQTTINAVRSGTNADIGLISYGASSVYRGASTNGTLGAATATPADRIIASLAGHGYDGSNFSQTLGLLAIKSSQVFSSSNQGTYITLENTRNNSTTRVERVRIDTSGNVGIGNKGPGDLFAVGVNKFAVNSSGTIDTLGGIKTTGSFGSPAILASMDSTGRTANIAASTLYAVPASGAGMYRLSALIVETTAGSVSSTLPNLQVVYTDAQTSGTITMDATPILGIAGIGQTGALTANTVGTTVSGIVVVNAKASTNIQIQTVNYASSLAGMQFALHLKLEAL